MTDFSTDAVEWERLTVSPDKRELFAADLYFRECWDDAVAVFGGDTTDLLSSLAVVSLKPDAVVARRSTPILDFAVKHGLRPIVTMPLTLTRHSIRELWRYDWHVYPVDRLSFSTVWYTANDVLFFVFEGNVERLPASVRLASLKGSGVVEKRTAEQMRTVLQPPNRILNFVHVADEPADVVRELGIFLDRPQRLACFAEIAANRRANRYDEAVAAIRALEAAVPPHDLNFESSLERLERIYPAAAMLRRHVASKIGWRQLTALIDPADPRVGRWDFVTVSSSVIEYERDVPELMPALDVERWMVLPERCDDARRSSSAAALERASR